MPLPSRTRVTSRSWPTIRAILPALVRIRCTSGAISGTAAPRIPISSAPTTTAPSGLRRSCPTIPSICSWNWATRSRSAAWARSAVTSWSVITLPITPFSLRSGTVHSVTIRGGAPAVAGTTCSVRACEAAPRPGVSSGPSVGTQPASASTRASRAV